MVYNLESLLKDLSSTENNIEVFETELQRLKDHRSALREHVAAAKAILGQHKVTVE